MNGEKEDWVASNAYDIFSYDISSYESCKIE
jgi:hypothetical protein